MGKEKICFVHHFSILTVKLNHKRKTINIYSVYLFAFKRQLVLDTSGIIYTGEIRTTTFPPQRPRNIDMILLITTLGFHRWVSNR